MAAVADPLDVIRRVKTMTDEVVVGVSCGKDSVAAYLLCLEHFRRVGAFYQYITPDLSFHGQYLAMLEEKGGEKLVGRKIHRVPHWTLSRMLRQASLRPDCLPSSLTPEISIRDIEIHVSKLTGIWWHATGQKKIDSLERRAMLNQCDGIIVKSRRFFPLSEWSHRTVAAYLRDKDVPLSPEYEFQGFSYGGGLEGQQLKMLRDHFPEDYARVCKRFPYAEAELFRYEETGGLDRKGQV